MLVQVVISPYTLPVLNQDDTLSDSMVADDARTFNITVANWDHVVFIGDEYLTAWTTTDGVRSSCVVLALKEYLLTLPVPSSTGLESESLPESLRARTLTFCLQDQYELLRRAREVPGIAPSHISHARG